MVPTVKEVANITLTKLAKLANVSVSTASKAFSGSKEISNETREMIFRIAKEHNCFDKFYKNIYNKTVIAIICPEFRSRYYGNYISLLEAEISKRGATILVGCTDFDINKENELLEYYTTYAKVDGIIIVSPLSDSISNYSVPIISLNLCDGIDSIYYNMEDAVYESIKYLYDMGHKKIGFIGETLTHSKENYFYRAMNKLELEVNKNLVIISENRFEYAGYSSMEKLFNNKQLPTAILAAYDYIAIGAMHSIQSRGLKIPDDISIIGMDDIEEAAYLNPPLTTIKTFNQDACDLALNIIFKKISNPYFKTKQKIQLQSTLIKRNSVSTPRE